MEVLGTGGQKWSIKYLKKALEEANCGNPNSAYAYTSLYFDNLLSRTVDLELSNIDADLIHSSRNRCLKLNLVFTARLSRFFGHFNQANYLLIEAIRLAQGSNDFLRLKLALLERGMLEIAISRFAMLGRFVRDESAFKTTENELEFYFETPSLQILNKLPTTNNNLLASEEVPRTSNCVEELDFNAKYLLHQIEACENYLRALNLAIRCESFSLITNILKNCMSFDIGVDRAQHSKLIREAARAFVSTIHVSLFSNNSSIALEYLLDEFVEMQESILLPTIVFKSKKRLVNMEARAIIFVNAAYALALDGKFDKALTIIDEAKKRFTEEENSAAAYHWQLAKACIEFDANFFAGKDVNTDYLSCFSPTEANFREAVLCANKDEYLKASKILETRLNFLQNGIDKMLILRCFLLMGTLYCEGRAIKLGTKMLQDALHLAKNCEIELAVAMVQRRMAYVNIANNKCLKETKKLLEDCSEILENIESPRLERGMFFVTKYKYFSALIDSSDANNNDENVKNLIYYLDKARQTFADHYPQLEKNVYKEGCLLDKKIKNEIISNLCKKQFKEMTQTMPSSLNWFLF